MSDFYLLSTVKREPLETCRFLFDYEYYLKNRRNIRLFKTFKLKNKVDAWKHFLKYNKHKALNYRFNAPNKRAQLYHSYLQNSHLNIDGSNFDTEYYLENNSDVRTALEISKNSNINFPWKHFVTNGLYEMRPFKILDDHDEIPHPAHVDVEAQLDLNSEFTRSEVGSRYTDATVGDKSETSMAVSGSGDLHSLFTDDQILQALANLMAGYEPFITLLERGSTAGPCRDCKHDAGQHLHRPQEVAACDTGSVESEQVRLIPAED